MSLEDHQAALSLQISHKLRHTKAWRDTYQHMYVIGTCICLYDMLQQFFNEKAASGQLDGKGGLSEKTLRNLYTMLSTSLKQAYENDLINKNLAELVKLPKVEKVEMRVLSLSEEKALLEAIKASTERYKIGVLICPKHWYPCR